MNKQQKHEELKQSYFIVDDLRASYGREFLSLSESASALGLAYGSLRNMVVEGRSPVRTVLLGSKRVVPIVELARLIFEGSTGEKFHVEIGNIFPIQKSPVTAASTKGGAGRRGRRSNEEKAQLAAAADREVQHG